MKNAFEKNDRDANKFIKIAIPLNPSNRVDLLQSLELADFDQVND